MNRSTYPAKIQFYGPQIPKFVELGRDGPIPVQGTHPTPGHVGPIFLKLFEINCQNPRYNIFYHL